jgi:hypothetical protein
VTVEASTAIAALLAGPTRPARVLRASATAAYLAVDGIEVIAVVAAGVAAAAATAMPLVAEPATVTGSAAEDVMRGNGVTSPPGPGTPGSR